MRTGGRRAFCILTVILFLLVSFLTAATAFATGSDTAEEAASEFPPESISVFSLVALIGCGAVTIFIVVTSIVSNNKKRRDQDLRQQERILN